MSDAITLEELAMLVECPTCGACDISGEDVEGCWDMEGRDREPVHAERLDAAREHLTRSRDVIASIRTT